MSYQLPMSVADALLDKLGSDDSFRSLFVQDTRGALASLGFAPAADTAMHVGIWACLSVNELASKEAIRNGRSMLRQQLVTCVPQSPFALEIAQARQQAA
jgi:putative modified peptide